MQKFLLSSFFLLFSLFSVAQTPFAGCGDAFYLISGPASSGSLYNVDTTDLSAAAFGSPIPILLSGIGYNRTDDFIYGLNDDNNNGTPDLYRVDATGATTNLATIPPPPVGAGEFGSAILSYVGDIDENGIYHFPAVLVRDINTADYVLYLGTIDLSNTSYMPMYTPITTTSGGCQPLVDAFVTELVAYYMDQSLPEPDGGIQDWAFNPIDGKLYSYLGVEGYVFELESNGNALCHPAAGGPMTQFGAILFDRSGDMYGYESTTGNSFSITYDNCPGAACGTLTAQTTLATSENLDAASCPWPLPVAPPEATVPFDGCDNAFFLSQSGTGGGATPSTLLSIDTIDISTTALPATDIPFLIGGMGYNSQDNFLYGMNDMETDGTPELYRIDALGNYTNLGSISPPTTGAFGNAVLWHVGDISEDGKFYFPAVAVNDFNPPGDYTVYLGMIDLTGPLTDPITPTYTVINTSGGGCQVLVDAFVADLIDFYLNGGPEPEGGIQDWAFNPNDGLLYSYLGIEASVLTLDISNGNTNCYASPNGSLTQFGGIFFDHSGDMYGIEQTGDTYMIDVSACPSATCGALTAGTTLPADIRVDAASCPWPIQVELEAFPGCIDYGVLSLSGPGGGNVPSTLYSADTTAFAITSLGLTFPIHMNGLGFNYVDNFLYAMNDVSGNGAPQLYKIGVNGNYEMLGDVTPPPGGAFGSVVLWSVADIDENGVYHFPAITVEDINSNPPDYQMHLGTIDLVNDPTFTPSYTPLTGGTCQPLVNTYVADLIDYYLNGGTEPTGGIQDWAFNPLDGLLYSYLGAEAYAFVMDPSTAVAECYATTNDPATQFGGIFFDVSGDMYGIESDAGNTFMIDVSGCPAAPCGELTELTSYLIEQRGDAASCPWEPFILPLELVSFTGTKDRFDVVLDWVTAYEEDNENFIIERSSNGIDFSVIGEVRGAGNSIQTISYQHKDTNPNPGLNYYRLSFVDIEGNLEIYPHLVVVDMEKGSLYFTVNPNPTKGMLQVQMLTSSSEQIQIEIFDVAGKLQIETVIAPFNFYKDIDVSELSPGVYMLKAKNGVTGYVQRFVKQ